ncbi:MAG: hypothetical protein PHI12_14440 [Dehalococcoidales bacterium]|nr:hypothetical protein [Dehalococcoidales bacterium]
MKTDFENRLTELVYELVSDDPLGALEYSYQTYRPCVEEAVLMYAKNHNLCPQCLSPLEVIEQKHPWGSTVAIEKIVVCRRCG